MKRFVFGVFYGPENVDLSRFLMMTDDSVSPNFAYISLCRLLHSNDTKLISVMYIFKYSLRMHETCDEPVIIEEN